MKYLLLIFVLTICFFPEAAPQGNNVNNPFKNPIIKLMQQKNKSKIPFKLPDRQLGLIYQPSVVTFDDTVKWTYTYDNEGNNITQLVQGWSNNNWVNESLLTYTYTSTGKNLSELYQFWTLNAWVNTYRTTLTYNESGYADSYTI